MDYQSMIEAFKGVACVLSQKDYVNGGKEIVITAANRNYIASVNKLDENFVPGRPYSYYIPADPNFEALVSDCISLRKISHQYVNAELYGAWLDIYMLPLENDGDGNGCCLFTYEMTKMSDSNRMINISYQTAYMVLKTCIKLRENDDFPGAMNSIVKDIRNQCESEGCAIILIDSERRKIDMLFFDHSGSFAPEENDVFFKPEFYSVVENWRNVMGGSNCFIIPGEEQLKEVEKKDPDWYNSLVYSGVKNLILYPLRIGRNLYGYIFATNFNSDKTDFIREVMELNAFILSAETENYRMRLTLEKMGKTDMLTGVLNRNAMDNRMSDHENTAPDIRAGVGVIYIDVNGLKRVNDAKGHKKGDEMLKKVADRLKTVFDSDSIYRAGGDEFLIISSVDRSDFDLLLEKLKSVSRVEGEPTFAVGGYYDDTGMDINKIMHIADTEMYRNKAEFYESNPNMDRRSPKC